MHISLEPVDILVQNFFCMYMVPRYITCMSHNPNNQCKWVFLADLLFFLIFSLQKILNLMWIDWFLVILICYTPYDSEHTDIWFRYPIFKIDIARPLRSWPFTKMIDLVSLWFIDERIIQSLWKFFWIVYIPLCITY